MSGSWFGDEKTGKILLCVWVLPPYSPISIGKEQSLKAEDRKTEELILVPNISQFLSMIRCKVLSLFSLQICFCKIEVIMFTGKLEAEVVWCFRNKAIITHFRTS